MDDEKTKRSKHRLLNLLLIFTGIFSIYGCRSDSLTANKEPNSLPKKDCNFASYKPIRVSHFVRYFTISKVAPVYPKEAIRRKIQGKVKVSILVNPKGNVVIACAVSGESILRSVSADAARKWKFEERGAKSFVQDMIEFSYVLGSNEGEVTIAK